MATEEVEEAAPSAPEAESAAPATPSDGKKDPGPEEGDDVAEEEEKTGDGSSLGESKDGDGDDELTEAAFDKWISDAKESKLNATVSDPTVVSTGMMGQVKYGYKVAAPLGSSEGVWRRYSDFEWLYNVLAAATLAW